MSWLTIEEMWSTGSAHFSASVLWLTSWLPGDGLNRRLMFCKDGPCLAHCSGTTSALSPAKKVISDRGPEWSSNSPSGILWSKRFHTERCDFLGNSTTTHPGAKSLKHSTLTVVSTLNATGFERENIQFSSVHLEDKCHSVSSGGASNYEERPSQVSMQSTRHLGYIL